MGSGFTAGSGVRVSAKPNSPKPKPETPKPHKNSTEDSKH